MQRDFRENWLNETVFYAGTSEDFYLCFQYFLADFDKLGAKDFYVISLND
jgi:hypothetical protein